MAILTTKDLCKTYGSGDNAVHALNHVALTVEEGEFVSSVGTSGSGKSTFLNLVGGLDKPTSGEVWVRGHDLGQLSDEQLREAGIAPDLIRLSVGIEDVDDIIADITQALDKTFGK